MSDRPNFYLLLDLDPKVDEWLTIEKRLKDKQREWSADRQGNPKKRRIAESSLARIKEIEAVLKNDETRRQEAKEAVRQLQKARQEQTRDLDGAIEVLKTGGGRCTAEQLKSLAQRFSGTFAADEIKKRLQAAGLQLEGGPSADRKPRPAKEKIDNVTAGNVRRNLDHLRLKNLYELLELKPQSSPKALCDRADEIYRENQRLGRTDTDASARNELAGLCKSLFQNDREKAKYDNYLAVEAMEALKPDLELAGGDGFLARGEIDALVKRARQLGVSTEDARAYIEDHALSRKWGMQRDGGELPAETLKLCGFCADLAPATAMKCSNCGHLLEPLCPRCGTKTPSTHAACASCGCRTGDAPLVMALLKEGEHLAVEGDTAGALQRFDKALLYWPDWKPAMEARRQVEERRKQRETELSAIEELLRQRKLAAAQSALDRFERGYGPAGLEPLKWQLQEGLARAETAFQEGERRRRSGDGEAALDRFEEALAACADYEPALRASAASPPLPPSVLQVSTLAAGFRLTWKAAGTGRGVAYRVLRKAGGGPQTTADGEALGEVRSTMLDDADAPVGVLWHYAVFSVRGGTACHEPAASGPHLRTAEVEDLEAVAGDREVTLRWKAPPGCRRVEAWRRRGALPERPGDGTAVTVAGNSAHDTGLTSGEAYGYVVVAVFPDPTRPGGEQRTSGRTVLATPVAPPAAVVDLRASRTGKNVLLSWTSVPGATVQIRQASRLPDYAPGLILPVSQADRFGTLVLGATSNGAQVTLAGQGRTFFVPLSVSAGTAVAGRAVEITTLDPVAGLKASRSGPNLVLTWDWPPGTDEVVVAWAHDRHPEDPRTGNGQRVTVTRREYERTGCWLLPHAERKAHYISIFAKAPGDLYAPAAQIVENMGEAACVTYEVVVKKSLLRRRIEGAWLALTCSDHSRSALPPLMMVGKAQSVPMSPRDGELLEEIPAVHLAEGRATLPIPERHWVRHPYVKLFFRDGMDAKQIRLLPAEKERLRLD
ncbi:MAG: hypothetical protein QOH06_2478 [Acidobacteriota bacterium]|jgi:hypothetical protein|nr:hypothetical protein [Acidobacteriota bacterium]